MAKTVLITGTSRGIGLALSQQFLHNGYAVIGTSRTSKMEQLSHPGLRVLTLDLANETTINELDRFLEQHNIGIDILINNAAIGSDLNTLKPGTESFKNTFDVNVTGTVFFTELVSRHVKTGGKIINISSKMGSIALCELTDSVAYRMSKTALNMYTKILTNRLQGRQTVAAVHPGWVRTTIAGSSMQGRLSPQESALEIFNFVTSNFETGTFWNIETGSKIPW
jgi:NAD(P)-dependent dehydrogenase (short-subunit alcohol dehydrogenase family)